MSGKYLQVQVKVDMIHLDGTQLRSGLKGKVIATNPQGDRLVKFEGKQQPLSMHPDDLTIVGRTN